MLVHNECPYAAQHEQAKALFLAKGGRSRSRSPKGAGKGSSKGSGKGSRIGSRDSSPNRSRSPQHSPRDRVRSRSDSPYRAPSRPEGNGYQRTKCLSMKGKSPSGKENRDPCMDYVKGSCKRGRTCDFWHPDICKLFSDRQACKHGLECEFLHPKSARSSSKGSGKELESVKRITPKNSRNSQSMTKSRGL